MSSDDSSNGSEPSRRNKTNGKSGAIVKKNTMPRYTKDGTLLLAYGSNNHLDEPVNFPLTLLSRRWEKNKAYFPLSLVRRYLRGSYQAVSEKPAKYTFIKESKSSRHLYKGSYDGPTLEHCNEYTIVFFQAQWEQYIEQGGLHDLKKAIIGSAAVDLKDKCDIFDKIIQADKWRVIHEQWGPKTVTAFDNLMKYITCKMYGFHEMDGMEDAIIIAILRSYMLIVVQVVKHLPPRLVGQITRKDLVDKFLDFIPPYVCSNVKNVLKKYIKTYFTASVKTQRLNSKDGWNLLFTITVMKSFLTDLQETMESTGSTNWRSGQKELWSWPSKQAKKCLLQLTAPTTSPKMHWRPTTAPFNSVQTMDRSTNRGYQNPQTYWSSSKVSFNLVQEMDHGDDGDYYGSCGENSSPGNDYSGSQDVKNTPQFEERERTTLFNTISNTNQDQYTPPYVTRADNSTAQYRLNQQYNPDMLERQRKYYKENEWKSGPVFQVS